MARKKEKSVIFKKRLANNLFSESYNLKDAKKSFNESLRNL